MINSTFTTAMTNSKNPIVAIVLFGRNMPEFALKPSKISLRNYVVVIMAWLVTYVRAVRTLHPAAFAHLHAHAHEDSSCALATRNLVLR